jgi:hypothetical protein
LTPAEKIYVGLGLVALLIWWAYTKQGINPIVSESTGDVGTGAQQ